MTAAICAVVVAVGGWMAIRLTEESERLNTLLAVIAATDIPNTDDEAAHR